MWHFYPHDAILGKFYANNNCNGIFHLLCDIVSVFLSEFYDKKERKRWKGRLLVHVMWIDKNVIGDVLLVRWGRTLSPLGTYCQSVGDVLHRYWGRTFTLLGIQSCAIGVLSERNRGRTFVNPL